MSKPRKKRTPQEKFKIVMEGLRGDHGSIAALCNAYGITQTDFYRLSSWRTGRGFLNEAVSTRNASVLRTRITSFARRSAVLQWS